MSTTETQTPRERYQQWLNEFEDAVREACKAFPDADRPHAWLIFDPDDEDENWYEPDELCGLPVYRTPARLTHSGYDGEHQTVIPLWLGDVSRAKYDKMRREFEARLAKSGDF